MTTKTRRVRAELSQRIASMAAHEMLSREVDLAEQLGVSRSTLRQVLGGLAQLGLIYTIPGTGTFVADNRVAKSSGLSGFSEDMRARGMEPGSRLLSAEPFVAEGTVAAQLNIVAGSLAYRIVRLRLADGEPMCIESISIAADIVPGLLTQDLTAGLYVLLKSKYGLVVVTSQQSVTAVKASPEQRELLGIAENEPLLEVFHIGHDDRGRVIERAISQYRADRYHFMILARRNNSI